MVGLKTTIVYMTAKYFIPLQEIEKAIRINCQVDHSALKNLTLLKDKSNKNQGVGRLLFIFVADRLGYDKEIICDYLAISTIEFDNKVESLPKMYKTGKYLFTKKTRTEEDDETSLLFYRKLLLVGNYLRYKYSYDL